MVWILKHGATEEEMAELKRKVAAECPQTEDVSSKKGLDIKKYCGVLKLTEDPMVIQKRLRDEWE